MTAISDLILKCKQGNTQAQQEFFRLTGPKMLALCRRYCKNEDDARDAMQEGFIKVFNSLEKYRGDSAPETWMGRIFINTAIDHYKKSRNYNNTFGSLTENMDVEEEAYNDNPFPCKAQDILKILDQMPEGYRMVFNLYCIENFNHKQIAEMLGISEGTSKSQYARAKQFIFTTLKNSGLLNE